MLSPLETALIALLLVSLMFGMGATLTLAFETGVQNSPLCFAILATAFAGEAQLEMLKLPLLYALFVLIEASAVTAVYRLQDARKSVAPAAPMQPSIDL